MHGILQEVLSAIKKWKDQDFMIKNAKSFEKFENNLKRDEKPDFYKNLRIVIKLHSEAVKLGVFAKNPLDGIETDIEIAKVVNSA